MRPAFASMLRVVLIAGALAGIIAWYIDFARQITGNEGFNRVLALAAAGGTVCGVGGMALLRVDGASLLRVAAWGPDQVRVSLLGPLGWAALGVVGVSLYGLMFGFLYFILASFTQGGVRMYSGSWPSGHYLAILLAGCTSAMMVYIVVLSHLWPRRNHE